MAKLKAVSFSPTLSVVTLATLGGYTLFTVRISKWREGLRRGLNQTTQSVAKHQHESLQHSELVRQFNRLPFELQSMKKLLSQWRQRQGHFQGSLSLLNSGQNAIFSAGLIGLLTLSTLPSTVTGMPPMTAGDLLFLSSLLLQLSIPLNFVGMVYRETKESLTDVEVLFALRQVQPPSLFPLSSSSVSQPTTTATTPATLSFPVPITDGWVDLKIPAVSTMKSTEPSPPNQQIVPLTPTSSPIVAFADLTVPSIHFDRVSFSYDPHRPILHDVTFTIATGSRVAFVGGSGSGKSTILRLLQRQYLPTQGSISLWNYDHRLLTSSSLHSLIACVQQESAFFHHSILYNLSYALPGHPPITDTNSISAELQSKLDDALQSSQLAPLIKTLPRGLQESIGERGVKLSGGERARLSMARSFLRHDIASILLFDESTAQLDSETETRAMQTLDRWHALNPTMTCIFVAHRLSTIVNCDTIFVLDHGRIIEQGTHEQLLARNGRYRTLWQLQQQTETHA